MNSWRTAGNCFRTDFFYNTHQLVYEVCEVFFDFKDTISFDTQLYRGFSLSKMKHAFDELDKDAKIISCFSCRLSVGCINISSKKCTLSCLDHLNFKKMLLPIKYSFLLIIHTL